MWHQEIWSQVTEFQSIFRKNDFWDIFLLSLLCYVGLKVIRGTRAVQILLGLTFLYILYTLAKKYELYTLEFVLNEFYNNMFIILVILFQDDIRRGLMQLGKVYRTKMELEDIYINEVIRAMENLKKKKLGALIVIERSTGLKDLVQVVAKIDAEVNASLLTSIFLTTSPMHDGAVIIQNNRIVAAACLLPLTKNDKLDQVYGTRHRAALGLTEQSDAIAIVLSEERNEISTVFNGIISTNLSSNQLRTILTSIH